MLHFKYFVMARCNRPLGVNQIHKLLNFCFIYLDLQ